ncbi:g8910 [Coccomyxa elongata]
MRRDVTNLESKFARHLSSAIDAPRAEEPLHLRAGAPSVHREPGPELQEAAEQAGDDVWPPDPAEQEAEAMEGMEDDAPEQEEEADLYDYAEENAAVASGPKQEISAELLAKALVIAKEKAQGTSERPTKRARTEGVGRFGRAPVRHSAAARTAPPDFLEKVFVPEDATPDTFEYIAYRDDGDPRPFAIDLQRQLADHKACFFCWESGHPFKECPTMRKKNKTHILRRGAPQASGGGGRFGGRSSGRFSGRRGGGRSGGSSPGVGRPGATSHLAAKFQGKKP